MFRSRLRNRGIVMHDRLDTIDWSFLIGKAVASVCIWESHVRINMADNISIDISYQFSYTTSRESVLWSLGEPDKARVLTSTINHSAQKATAVNDDALIIEFDNNDVLAILMGHNGYESFSVMGPGHNDGIFV
jgi:hypothetical protein